MTISYNCTVTYSDYVDPEFGGLDMKLVSKAISALEHDGYDVYRDATGFEVSGEIESDFGDKSANDVADDIKITLWKVADIDADVDTETYYTDDEASQFSTHTFQILP